MPCRNAVRLTVRVLALAALAIPGTAPAQHDHDHHAKTSADYGIPASLRVEHAAIHATLVEATQAPGRVGEAARALAAVLHPHFVREEEIALPPLGLLAPLVAGDTVPADVLSRALAQSDSLKAELPRMLEEHGAVRIAVTKLHEAALAEKSDRYVRLAEELAGHALAEEELFYPAAVLVGEIIRGRGQAK